MEDELPPEIARTLVRRRLRSEFDAGRSREVADPSIPDADHDGRARPHPACARSDPGRGHRLADRRSRTRQLGDGRLGGPICGSRSRRRNEAQADRRIVRRQTVRRPRDRRGRNGAHFHRRRNASRRRRGCDAGARGGSGRRRDDRASRGGKGRPESPPCRRGSATRRCCVPPATN